MAYYGPTCPPGGCPPVGVDAPARTVGHYLVPRYVAPNLAGYNGAGGLGDAAKKEQLKLTKVVVKLERGEPITQAERDYVANAKPFPSKSVAKVQASDQAVVFAANALSFLGVAAPVPFLPLLAGSQILYALAYGGDVGKIGKANMRSMADQLSIANVAVGFIPGVPPNFPKITKALEKIARTVGDDKPLDTAAVAELSAGVAGIFAESSDGDIRKMGENIQGVLKFIQKIPGVGAAFSPSKKSNVQSAAAQASQVKNEAAYNKLLQRAKSLLQTTSSKVGPAGAGFRMPTTGAGFRRLPAPGGLRPATSSVRPTTSSSSSASSASSSSMLPLLLLAGAAVVAISVAKRK